MRKLVAPKKKLASVEDLIKILKDFDASKVQLMSADKARFQRIRLAEEQAKEVDYELGEIV